MAARREDRGRRDPNPRWVVTYDARNASVTAKLKVVDPIEPLEIKPD
jgi:hypothetical protein